MLLEIGLMMFGVLFSIVGWLLKNKDDTQSKQIANLENRIASLYQKYDQNTVAIQDLRLQIAREHYQKAELDDRFTELKVTIKDGLRDMADRFDKLAEAMRMHMIEESRRRDE